MASCDTWHHLTVVMSASWTFQLLSTFFAVKKQKKQDTLHEVYYWCHCSANHILSNNCRVWQDKIGTIIAISRHLKLWNYARMGQGISEGNGNQSVPLPFYILPWKKTVMFNVIYLKFYQNQVNLVAKTLKRFSYPPICCLWVLSVCKVF